MGSSGRDTVTTPVIGLSIRSGEVSIPEFQVDRATIFVRSARCAYCRPISWVSFRRPSERVVGLRPKRQEAVTGHVQLVLGRLLARVRKVGDLDARELGEQLGEVADPVGLGDLVEDRDLLAAARAGC